MVKIYFETPAEAEKLKPGNFCSYLHCHRCGGATCTDTYITPNCLVCDHPMAQTLSRDDLIELGQLRERVKSRRRDHTDPQTHMPSAPEAWMRELVTQYRELRNAIPGDHYEYTTPGGLASAAAYTQRRFSFWMLDDIVHSVRSALKRAEEATET